MSNTPTLFKRAKRYTSVFLGGLLGFLLSPAYTIIEASIGVIFLSLLSPFLLLKHLHAKYTNRRLAGQTLGRALFSTLTVSLVGLSLKSLVIGYHVLRATLGFLLSVFINPFNKIKFAIERGFLSAISPWTRLMQAKDHPLHHHLKAYTQHLQQQRENTNLSKPEKNTLETALKRTQTNIRALNNMIAPTLWTQLKLISTLLFSFLSPKIKNVSEASTINIRTNPYLYFVSAYRNAFNTLWSSSKTNPSHHCKTTEFIHLLNPAPRDYNLLTAHEITELSAQQNSPTVEWLSEYKNAVEETRCPISLNDISTQNIKPITVIYTQQNKETSEKLEKYDIYHEPDLLHWINQSHELRTPEAVSLAFIDLDYPQAHTANQSFTGKNIDHMTLTILRDLPETLKYRLNALTEKLRLQLPRGSSTATLLHRNSILYSQAQIHPARLSNSLSFSEQGTASPSHQPEFASTSTSPLLQAQLKTPVIPIEANKEHVMLNTHMIEFTL